MSAALKCLAYLCALIGAYTVIAIVFGIVSARTGWPLTLQNGFVGGVVTVWIGAAFFPKRRA